MFAVSLVSAVLPYVMAADFRGFSKGVCDLVKVTLSVAKNNPGVGNLFCFSPNPLAKSQ